MSAQGGHRRLVELRALGELGDRRLVDGPPGGLAGAGEQDVQRADELLRRVGAGVSGGDDLLGLVRHGRVPPVLGLSDDAGLDRRLVNCVVGNRCESANSAHGAVLVLN